MKHYDVIIIGGGIAGTSLAYNLLKYSPEKSVLLIEKEDIGSNQGYGYRNTPQEVIERYGLNYHHKYYGIKIGSYNQVQTILKKEFYLIDYSEVCKDFFKRSKAFINKDKALSIKENSLVTDKNEYSFEYLVDCSGSGFFLKKILHQSFPMRYWIGKVGTISKPQMNFDENYYYFMWDDNGFLEELYPLGKKILYGNWQYVKQIDFGLIKPPKKTLYNKFFKNNQKKDILENVKNVVIPCAPAFPIVYKNFALLGDSFGNATTSSAEGIGPILKSSELLAIAISLKNLSFYEREWKKRFFSVYLKFLISKIDRYENSELMKKIKQYPTQKELIMLLKDHKDVFIKILENDPNFKFPKEIKSKFPKRQLLFQLYYYLNLKLKYATM